MEGVGGCKLVGSDWKVLHVNKESQAEHLVGGGTRGHKGCEQGSVTLFGIFFQV